MKLNKFSYLYSKPLGNHTLKIMKKIPGNLLKKTWKNHENIMEFCQSEKVGTLQNLNNAFEQLCMAGFVSSSAGETSNVGSISEHRWITLI